jgi:hypothetical protein
MRTREAVLDYQLTKSDTATYEKDLDLEDPISALGLWVSCANGTTSNKANTIEDIVTKIEIVDGSEVLFSANMFELAALEFHKTGKMSNGYPSEWPSGNQSCNPMILFGRKKWDQQYAFDPKAFRNPQLKISLNKAAVRAASATTAFGIGDTIKVGVVAHLMENMGSRPAKFLTLKQVNTWTSGTSGDRRIELPIDFPYRLLQLRAYLYTYGIKELITNMKMECDSGKFIPFNRKVEDLNAEALAQFGYGRKKHDLFISNDEEGQLIFNGEPTFTIYDVLQNNFNIIGSPYAWDSRVKLWIGTHAGVADGTDRSYLVSEFGHLPYAVQPYAFGDMNDEATWFNPKEFGKVELVVTEAVAGVCSVSLEQVRPNMKLG